MMTDLLPIVTRLSRALQASSIDISQLHQLVGSTVQSLELLHVTPGPQLSKLDSDLGDSLLNLLSILMLTRKNSFMIKYLLLSLKLSSVTSKNACLTLESLQLFLCLNPASYLLLLKKQHFRSMERSKLRC